MQWATLAFGLVCRRLSATAISPTDIDLVSATPATAGVALGNQRWSEALCDRIAACPDCLSGGRDRRRCTLVGASATWSLQRSKTEANLGRLRVANRACPPNGGD